LLSTDLRIILYVKLIRLAFLDLEMCNYDVNRSRARHSGTRLESKQLEKWRFGGLAFEANLGKKLARCQLFQLNSIIILKKMKFL
jgi:hypothetical protein